MTERLRVGTRGSRLAWTQTESVIAELSRVARGLRFEAVPVVTSGDRDRSPRSSPDFTDAIDRALLRGDVDLAVHSAKDLPLRLDPKLDLAACPPRADPRDCLVVAPTISATRLPHGTRVGSSSLRRRAQLLRWRADLRVVEVRGNVDTRLRLAGNRSVDAVVLALAGITRLGRASEVSRILPVTAFLPAPAQGALAVVVRADDARLGSVVRGIDHAGSHARVLAERSFAATLGGDCEMPLGALATLRGRSLSLRGEVLTADGRTSLRRRLAGSTERAEEVGRRLGEEMLDSGARDLLPPARA